MYNENDRHCSECQCAMCDLRGTPDCLDGETVCAECDNESHVDDCPWYSNEDDDEGG